MAFIQGTTSSGGIKNWLIRASGLMRVESVSIFAEEEAAKDGDAYIFHGICHTAAATSGILMYIKNTNTNLRQNY